MSGRSRPSVLQRVVGRRQRAIEARKGSVPSLLDFFEGAWAVLEPGVPLEINWHHELICEYLQEIAAGNISNLLINCPPRHLKSRIVSVAYPCWRWLTHPHIRFLCLSYTSSLAVDHNYDRRRLVQSEWYQGLSGGLALELGKNRLTEFSNEKQGAMLARGLDGSVTGVGGDEIIFDDPNDPEKVESEVVRTATLKRFKAYSSDRRNNPNAPIIVVQQRTHEDDVSGFIRKQPDGGGYLFVCLPTKAEEEEAIAFPRLGRIIQRSPGDILHPARFGGDLLVKAEQLLGSYLWAARHQQRPVPLGGGIIKEKWFERYRDRQARYEMIVQSWDTAKKGEAVNCPWAGLTFGIKGGIADLLHVHTERHDYPDGKRVVENLYLQFRPNVLIIEDQATGSALLQEFKKHGIESDRGPVYPSLKATIPTVDKITRMVTETLALESGKVRLPEYAPWLADFEAVIFRFPNASINDPVDALSQFLAWWRVHGAVVRRVVPTQVSSGDPIQDALDARRGRSL